MKACLITLLVFSFTTASSQLITHFEKTGGKETPTYQQAIAWWQKLDASSGKVKLLTMGATDAGYPLHLAVISNSGEYHFANIRQRNKRIILINNGIHPGEPDGIDASMLLARDIASGKVRLPDNVVLAIIPVYNIGGALNRSRFFRVDQEGPEEFGFRGNSRNYDLNRDFIKNDTREARSFAQIFHLVDPDVFIDNHVSNGADYQHVMTLIATQHNKLGGTMGRFMQEEFEPGLYAGMKEKGHLLIPYVNAFGDSPDNGWPEFWDGPRYSSGYTALFHCFSFVAETHMLKPYSQRVKATYDLMHTLAEFTSRNSEAIKERRRADRKAVTSQTLFPISWKLNKEKFSEREYHGYKAGRKTSGVSGLPRLYYDRQQPYQKTIPFYNVYEINKEINKPKAYIIPQGWWQVTDLLKLNKVKMIPLARDTSIEVEVYRIEKYVASTRPYEGHHPNTGVETSSQVLTMKFRKGDLYIPMNQVANRFLVEVLEPAAEDSYFTWNFFDPILQQKEGYSGYAFEDIAASYLEKDPALRKKLEERRNSDSSFAKSAGQQLNFVYQHSPFYEPDHLRYPVYRVR